MAVTNKIIGRSDVGEQLMPPEVTQTIIEEAPKESIMLAAATKATMSTKKQIQPVLATLPEAYWVNGDTGLKETTNATWKGVQMVAEELAVVVPIPDAVIDDASVNLWDMIKPRLVEAFGKRIDEAALFGVDKPSTWPEALVPAAEAAGNVAQVDPKGKTTIADAALEVAGKMATQGFSVNGFASAPGLGWRLRALKDNNGAYMYGAPGETGAAASLFGYPLRETLTGAWDASRAELVMADWSKVIIGIRQDITFEMFREGVITDSTGKVVLNLMQQDTKAMRVVMRLGYQVANPITGLEGTEAKRFPAGVVKPAAAASAGA
ncbi:phage major capsid protein [Nanchangia anserum]|uniref:Phage major capsid protein n=1 Tax=Nanchangia anserum TaxID=2692125 RepID=A0A8I0KQD6_9ACTO|nr:phage major capsid protein [Nanchangia anserum]MBD3689870.1 phage major capsid protein [Nanchangia anserum]QOX82038.1 phage major capsid protein [Nanchangia anserum]